LAIAIFSCALLFLKCLSLLFKSSYNYPYSVDTLIFHALNLGPESASVFSAGGVYISNSGLVPARGDSGLTSVIGRSGLSTGSSGLSGIGRVGLSIVTGGSGLGIIGSFAAVGGSDLWLILCPVAKG